MDPVDEIGRICDDGEPDKLSRIAAVIGMDKVEETRDQWRKAAQAFELRAMRVETAARMAIEELRRCGVSGYATRASEFLQRAVGVQSFITPSERDWPEDFAHENGDYQCRCCHCNNIFHGHKRRVSCKVCSSGSAGNAGVTAAHQQTKPPADADAG